MDIIVEIKVLASVEEIPLHTLVMDIFCTQLSVYKVRQLQSRQKLLLCKHGLLRVCPTPTLDCKLLSVYTTIDQRLVR